MVRLALGTVQFGLDYGVSNSVGQAGPNTVSSLLAQAVVGGIDLLDTAPAYGEAENVLGRAGTNGFQIVSKLAAGTRPTNVKQALAATLATLKRDRLAGYIVHDSADLLGSNGAAIWAELVAARDAGLVDRIGASVYSPEEVSQLLNRYPLELVQMPLNPLDARWEAAGILTKLTAAAVEVHVRSVFLQGLLLMTTPPAALASWAGHLSGFRDWCVETGQSPVAACLGHILAMPEVSRAVIGVTGTAELAEALAVQPSQTPIPSSLRTEDPVLLNPARWPQ